MNTLGLTSSIEINLHNILKADFFIDWICTDNVAAEVWLLRGIGEYLVGMEGVDECRCCLVNFSKPLLSYWIRCTHIGEEHDSVPLDFDQRTSLINPTEYKRCAINAYKMQRINAGKTKKNVAEI